MEEVVVEQGMSIGQLVSGYGFPIIASLFM